MLLERTIIVVRDGLLRTLAAGGGAQTSGLEKPAKVIMFVTIA